MAAYVVVEVETTDAALMGKYRELVPPSVAAFGGRFLARGGRTATLEGGWDPPRLVILEFPTLAAAEAWWASDEYAEAKKMRQRAGKSRMVAVEGV